MRITKNKISKSIFLVMLSIVLVISLVGCAPKDSDINEQQKKSEDKINSISFIESDGEIYVSLKDAFESVDGKYSEGKDGVKASKDNDELSINTKENKAVLNGKDIQFKKEYLKIENNDVYVIMNFLNEVLDARTIFNEEEKIVEIREEIPLEYTKAFSVKYLKGGFKKIEDGDGRTLILAPEGKKVPEEYKDEMIVNIPLKNVLISATTQACLLRPIDELKSIKAVTTDLNQWTMDEIKSGMKEENITFVGENNAPDYEKICSLKPDIVFTYSGPYGTQDMMQKLDELGVVYAVDNEYLEEDPLGRLEWIKFISAFYDKEDMAEKYFDEVVNNVNDISEKLASVEKPTIAWGMIFDGKVYVPDGNSFAAKMIEMAGGDYIFKDSSIENGEISIEEFYDKGKNADIFMYSSSISYSPNFKDIIEMEPSLADFKAVKEKNVWCLDDDYHQSIDKTDELITSLATIFHPDEMKQSEVKHFVKYTE